MTLSLEKANRLTNNFNRHFGPHHLQILKSDLPLQGCSWQSLIFERDTTASIRHLLLNMIHYFAIKMDI